jgi:mycofactocin precursor
MADATTPAGDIAAPETDDTVIDVVLVDDVLVEEVSIDGMCGVY